MRLLKSKNEVIAEGASETLLHIVTTSEGSPQSHPSQTALRAAGAIPSLLGVVRFCVSAHLAGDASLEGVSTLSCTYNAENCPWGTCSSVAFQDVCFLSLLRG